VTLEYNAIYGNSAALQGAGIFLVASQAILNNNTVASNSQPATVTESLGAGIHAAEGTASATGCNNIIYYNQAYADPEVHGDVTLTHSCLSTVMSGMGNITSAPQFINYPYYQFGLQSTSPCIDTGNPSSPLDPDSSRADMGALYYPHSQSSILSVFPSALSFAAVVAGANPPAQTFSIVNNGAGSFSYVITESITWLSVSPMSGGPVPPSVTETVSVNTAGLSAGTYQGNITISASGASGSPATVQVTLEVSPRPMLSVSPTTLTFTAEIGGGNPSNQTFSIANSGGGTFNYTVSETTTWLSVTPTNGGPVPPSATETVSLDIAGLTAGTHQADIRISAVGASGSPDTVHVILVLSQHPILSITPDSLEFEAEVGAGNPADQVFQIINQGSGTFNYSITAGKQWLSVTPASGGPVPPTVTEIVSVDVTGMSLGTHQGDITVTSPGIQGSPRTVHVTLTITQDPALSVSQDSMMFYAELGGGDPPDQMFQVDNAGTGTLNYVVLESVSWMSVTPGSGSAPPPTAELVSVDAGNLEAGSYGGDIIVSASGVPGSPDTVHVTLVVTQDPILSLTPSSLEFVAEVGGSNPSNRSFQILNAGTGSFTYSISENIPWLAVSPVGGGQVPPSATKTVSVDISQLPAGTYQGDVVVAAQGAQGSPAAVHVNLTVIQHPVLSLSTDLLDYVAALGGGNPLSQDFQILNLGTGILDYTISESISWLSVTPMTGGPVPPDANEVVSVDIADLPAGSYEGDIAVTAVGAENSPDTVHVSLTIDAEPILFVWPPELHFEGEVGSVPNIQTFTIFNLGTGTLSYAVDENVPWLSVTPMHGEPVPPEATDTVSVDLSGLEAGTYEGYLFVSAPGAQNSPDTVYVTLTVTQNPLLILSRTTMIFEAIAEGENPPEQTFLIDNGGTGAFDYSIVEDVPWLTVSPMSGGPVPPIATETVSVDIAELPAGTYNGDIVVMAAGAQGSPDTLHVELIIESAPVLLVEPVALVFNAMEGGPDPLPQLVTISNGGGGSFDFRILCQVPWLTVSNDSGGPVPPSVEDTVSVVNISGFGSGTYEYILTVEAEGVQQSPQEVHVLLEIGANGLRRIGGPELPREFALNAPYPNPFNPSTNVSFSMPVAGNVVLTVYDIRGRRVGEVFRGWIMAGTYQTTFDASGLSSGVYFCRMMTPTFESVRKMTLVK